MPYDGRTGVPSGDCNALFDNFGDQGDYFACLMSNGIQAENTVVDLNSLPNNVGDAPVAVQSDLPDWLARVFHPNINGMVAYRDAVVEAYEQYTPREAESSAVSSMPLPVFTFDPISTATSQSPEPTSVDVSALVEVPSTMATMAFATPASN